MAALAFEEIEKRIADSYEIPNNVVKYTPHPLVSVRTSAYNQGPYICQCIEGVLMQKTNFPIEYIIGEDFSSDETRDIVFRYARKYPNIIRVITADYNVGSKANGRRCARLCRGKYIAICEGDDYWIDPLKLQKQVDFLETNPDYGLVFTDFHRFFQKKSFLEKDIFKEGIMPVYRTFEEHLCIAGFLAPCSWVYKREFLSFKRLVDVVDGSFVMMLNVMQRTKVHYMKETTVVYRILEESASHSKSYKKNIKFSKGVFEVQKYFIKECKVDDNLKKTIYLSYYEKSFPYLFVMNESIEEITFARNLLNSSKKVSIRIKVFLFLSKTKIGVELIKLMYKIKYFPQK